MRLFNFFFSIAFLLLFFPELNAQNGIIRGSVFDETTGEPMISVTVMIEGTTKGIVTDLDGKFNLTIEPGIYNLKLSFVSYETKNIRDVKVTGGEVTLLDNLTLKSSTVDLSEVTVSASMTRNTEGAIMSIKMQSPNLIDGISAVNFKKMGDSDAASSMKRVPGVSVEGGRYVYVRGLGDRYTKTIINGVDIPGLDPDRNTMQLDIFPTSIIDNIVVYKSFTAELPADFTGGVIDIGIKDFPDQKKGNITLSTAYNPDFHFKNDYLTYPGGKTDFLGFDDGTRDIPATTNIPFFTEVIADPSGEEGMRYREILEDFNPTMAAMKQNSFMDYNLGVSFGDQLPVKKLTIGYNLGFSYKSNTEFYENAEYGRYGLSGDPDVTDLEVREFQIGDYGVQSVLLSGLAGVAVKTKTSKFRLNMIHLQNGESKAGIFDYTGSDQGSNFSGYQHNLEYSQRSLTNIMLDGKHNFNKSKWELVWKLSPTLSAIKDPDARFVRYIDGIENNYEINTESGFPERIWRDLSEINLVGVTHVTKEFKFNGQNARLNFGGSYAYKERDFIIRKYMFNIRNVPLTGDPDELFRPENLWPLYGTMTTSGTTYEADFVPSNPNQFNATSNNAAGYVSTEISLFKGLKAIAGLRLENFVQRYTGQDQLGTNILNNDIVLDDLGIFPSLNLIYSLTQNQNIRASYSKTIARPSFKELSYAEISDPISGRTFVGGMFRDEDAVAGIVYWDGNLVSTDIQNFDLRWELFRNNGQMISLSGFYKYFDKPIEIVQYATQAGAFQPRNVGDGQVIGAEIELRQNLDIIGKNFKNLSLTANISVTNSTIELSLTEYTSKVENARTGQTISKYRVMAGQAPYLINTGISYLGENGFWSGFEAGLYYNVQGTTLQYVGIADRPDIYTLPFHSLNLTTSKQVGKEKRMLIGFKIDNLLNDKKESVFRSFNPTDQFFTKLEPGITYHLKLSYALF